jgi:hypothetical protein
MAKTTRKAGKTNPIAPNTHVFIFSPIARHLPRRPRPWLDLNGLAALVLNWTGAEAK